ncbi:hypothetical protein BJ508DRAFT_343193 [Ascobolus immersus RN42]|uniref:Uncharacterized protein n=1 Tax=Ascobolus immersus RN42 TaxID=1160509 RepID=A0A3N4INL1_ASCIM|nr:hypothetical protein BJ508DRAFT_343193 [Ascobolus immersus RN42]
MPIVLLQAERSLPSKSASMQTSGLDSELTDRSLQAEDEPAMISEIEHQTSANTEDQKPTAETRSGTPGETDILNGRPLSQDMIDLFNRPQHQDAVRSLTDKAMRNQKRPGKLSLDSKEQALIDSSRVLLAVEGLATFIDLKTLDLSKLGNGNH